MRHKNLIRIFAICLVSTMVLTPINASAAALIKLGTKNSEVKLVQSTLKKMGYYKHPKITGYYGNITEKAVKQFQKDNGLSSDGIIGTKTRNVLLGAPAKKTLSAASVDSTKKGAFDWFNTVQYIWPRGASAVLTDVDTGKSFEVKRTYGTNHADIEPLTKQDANTIKSIWNGWSWERRAVIVQFDNYTIAASMTAMPHAGLDSAPAEKVVSGRSGGYGRGQNLDAVKNNGVNGVMDLHFKNSRTHFNNTKQSSHQNMVSKAAKYISKMEN